ncbi:MAG: YciI family protein [Candidatus Thorarchaeota archaeon]
MEKLSYVIMLRPAPSYGGEETEEIVGQHFKYLQSLQASGELVMAGRFNDVLIGLTMIECGSLERATEIMNNDPAVKANVFHAELYPWRVALDRE